jgi:hypothetical protein
MNLQAPKGKVIVQVGDRFGRWTVIEHLGLVHDKYSRKEAVRVLCDCGTVKQQFTATLKARATTSCGCFRRENAGEMMRTRERKHDLTHHPLYRLWAGMKTRCLNPKDKAYKDYGGRGITICDEWKDNFLAFYNWAMANGWEKGLINDRRDNDLGYSPTNCRFVTPPVSMRNTRMTHFIEFNGVRKCKMDWAIELGLSHTSLSKRIKKWGIERALTTPKQTV